LGQSQIIPYLSGLTKYSYQFIILSCDKPHLYKKNKVYVEALLKPYPIKWVSIPYHKNPPVLSSVYDFIELKKKAKEIYRNEKFDMVHTRPGVPTLVALWLKKKYHVKFLNDVRGFWADERVDGGMWNLKNPLFKRLYSFFKKHEYECIEKSDYTTCLTYQGRKEMLSWKNISNQPIPIEVIPCSVDLKLFNPQNINSALKEELQIELKFNKDDFIVSYLGSIGGWYLTEEMMQFCKVLLDKIPQTKFLFISPHRHEIILNAAKKYNIPSEKVIVKKVERHEVPTLLSFSDYSLFFIKPCYSKISSSPTKHGEIMAMGIPVITNAGVGDVEEITNKYNGGIVLKSLNKAEYNKAAELIVQGKAFNRDEIVAGANEYYNLDSAVQKYYSVYKKILG
jgi:glycosyltransferase involved in cell wall biosynthesis